MNEGVDRDRRLGERPAGGEGKIPSALEVERIVELIKQLCVTRTNLNLYSFDHTVGRESLNRSFAALSRLLDRRDQLTLDITQDTLLFEGLPVEERNPLVRGMARDLRSLRVNGFTFRRGITMREFSVFFKLLTLKKEEVEHLGGARALLEELRVEHIWINQVRYVRLEVDKKIVSRDARVVESVGDNKKEKAEKELIDGLLQALKNREADREWLLEEIRTDPPRVAGQIVAMIKYLDDQEVLESQEQRQEAMDALLGSIRTLGVRLAERAGSAEEDPDGRTLAQSMLILEQELKSRSAGLKSSRAVTRFVEEITSTVTAFIDNYQANLVMEEYLKDEKGLKRTERLLRSVMKDRGSEKSLVPRLESLLKRKGLGEKDLEAIIAQLLPGNEAEPPGKQSSPPKKKKRRRRAPKPVAEKIEKALAKKLETAGDREEALAYLSGVFRREVDARLKDAREEQSRLAGELKRVDDIISTAGMALVALDGTGRVVLATRRADEILGKGEEVTIPRELLAFIAAGDTDSPTARADFFSRILPDEADGLIRILNALERPVRGEDGVVLGLIFRTEQNPMP